MFWLTQPPYWRWLAAAAVVAFAAYLDLSGPPEETYPFVAEAVDPGVPVPVVWKAIPSGVLPPHGELSGVAGQALSAGTPLVNGLLSPAPRVPDDWWAVSVELPPTAEVGSDVMVTTRAPDLEVVGTVIMPSTSGGFGALSPGLVAFSPDQAAIIAKAVADHRATILVRP